MIVELSNHRTDLADLDIKLSLLYHWRKEFSKKASFLLNGKVILSAAEQELPQF